MAVFESEDGLHRHAVQTLIVLQQIGDVARASEPLVTVFDQLRALGHQTAPDSRNLPQNSFGRQRNKFAGTGLLRAYFAKKRGKSMLRADDLIRLAELIKLGAEAARHFSDSAPNGYISKITDATKRIDAAADELIQIGQELTRETL